MDDRQALFKQLPAVDRLLNDPVLNTLCGEIPRILVVEAAQEAVETLRRQIFVAPETPPDLSVPAVATLAARLAEAKATPSLRPVINATGTLLHTNLGRAPLSPVAINAITATARSYSNLEFDLKSGERGHRYSHVEELLCRLSGAEAAAVVNNNAGAVLLALAALARGKEAIVSRGELVEIGGAFRVPEVMAEGGVILREIGTTNKTHLADYRRAISENTGLFLKVHTSNYRIVGFTKQVPAAELVALGREHDLPVMEDLGSGMLFDLSGFGLPQEPTVAEGVASGIDVLTFSGDKLLGGPQAGLIVGKRWAIERIRRHPLARALRIDKLTLAALEATLRLYLEREKALREIPLLRMLGLTPQALEARCRDLATALSAILGERATVTVVAEASMVGGGALPLTELPGFALALVPHNLSCEELALRLRTGRPAVVGRLQEGRLLLNLRTVFDDEEEALVTAVTDACSTGAP